MFTLRQHLRRWTARVLVAWLFGAVVGIAHACVVVPVGNAHHDRLSAALAELHVDDHEHDAGTGSAANCQDLCEKTTTTLPSPQKDFYGFDSGAAPMPMAVGVQCAVQPLTLRVPADPPDRAASVSIPISLLRLAL